MAKKTLTLIIVSALIVATLAGIVIINKTGKKRMLEWGQVDSEVLVGVVLSRHLR